MGPTSRTRHCREWMGMLGVLGWQDLGDVAWWLSAGTVLPADPAASALPGCFPREFA